MNDALALQPLDMDHFKTPRRKIADRIVFDDRIVGRQKGHALGAAELESLFRGLGAHRHIDTGNTLKMIEKGKAAFLTAHIALRTHTQDQVIHQRFFQAAHRIIEVRRHVPHDDFPVGVRANLLIGNVIPVDGIDDAFRRISIISFSTFTLGPGVMIPITPRGPIAFTYR